MIRQTQKPPNLGGYALYLMASEKALLLMAGTTEACFSSIAA
ncbi:hypothetical protein ACQKGI_09485 [Peribacillus muralis]